MNAKNRVLPNTDMIALPVSDDNSEGEATALSNNNNSNNTNESSEKSGLLSGIKSVFKGSGGSGTGGGMWTAIASAAKGVMDSALGAAAKSDAQVTQRNLDRANARKSMISASQGSQKALVITMGAAAAVVAIVIMVVSLKN